MAPGTFVRNTIQASLKNTGEGWSYIWTAGGMGCWHPLKVLETSWVKSTWFSSWFRNSELFWLKIFGSSWASKLDSSSSRCSFGWFAAIAHGTEKFAFGHCRHCRPLGWEGDVAENDERKRPCWMVLIAIFIWSIAKFWSMWWNTPSGGWRCERSRSIRLSKLPSPSRKNPSIPSDRWGSVRGKSLFDFISALPGYSTLIKYFSSQVGRVLSPVFTEWEWRSMKTWVGNKAFLLHVDLVMSWAVNKVLF